MIDHLVYATPDLQATVELLTERLGVAPSPGGRHTGQGTRNYLLSLGTGSPVSSSGSPVSSCGSYLEIIGRDPEQPPPAGPRPFKLDDLDQPLLVGWSARAPHIEERVARARARGYDPGDVHAMTRTLPDGRVLNWKLTLRPASWFQAAVDAVPSLIPFLIDWGDSPHPSLTAAQGAELLAFRGETPDLSETQRILDALEVGLELGAGTTATLTAHIRGPRGEIVLSGRTQAMENSDRSAPGSPVSSSSSGSYFGNDATTRAPDARPRWIELEDVPSVELVPGLDFRPVVGAGALVNFVHFTPNTVAPRHAHAEEQFVFVLDGELEFECDGETRMLRRGSVVHIPPGVPHGARTHDSPCSEVDVFAPPRQALLDLMAASEHDAT